MMVAPEDSMDTLKQSDKDHVIKVA